MHGLGDTDGRPPSPWSLWGVTPRSDRAESKSSGKQQTLVTSWLLSMTVNQFQALNRTGSNRAGMSELASTENKGKAVTFALSPSHWIRPQLCGRQNRHQASKKKNPDSRAHCQCPNSFLDVLTHFSAVSPCRSAGAKHQQRPCPFTEQRENRLPKYSKLSIFPTHH